MTTLAPEACLKTGVKTISSASPNVSPVFVFSLAGQEL